MKRFITFALNAILAIALVSCSSTGPKPPGKKPPCVGDDCSLEKALVGGGTEAIIEAGKKTGCFDRIKIVGGKEVKNCWGTMRPAGKDSRWECIELHRREAPECYESTP